MNPIAKTIPKSIADKIMSMVGEDEIVINAKSNSIIRMFTDIPTDKDGMDCMSNETIDSWMADVKMELTKMNFEFFYNPANDWYEFVLGMNTEKSDDWGYLVIYTD